jgi:hypothetical protein
MRSASTEKKNSGTEEDLLLHSLFFHLLYGLWIASDWTKFAHSFGEKAVQNRGKCNRKQKGWENKPP